MCANYTPGRNDLIEAVTQLSVGFAVLPEVYPGQAAPLIRLTKEGEWQCTASSFGLIPTWAKDANFARHTYNARSETADSKPSFRNAWKQRQIGLVPMGSFYEPRYEASGVVRWRIRRHDKAIFFAAALYEWRKGPTPDGLVSHTLLTVNADGHPLMQKFHKPEDEKRSIVTFDWAYGVQWVIANQVQTQTSNTELKQSLIPIDADVYTSEPAPAKRTLNRTPDSDKTKIAKINNPIPKNEELF